MEACIFIGIQASGKSSFYKQHFIDTHIRLNLDMLKTRRREDILLKACIEARQPFVVDNTNPTRESREKYISAAGSAGFRIVGYYFESTIEDCLKRNKQRVKKACIPERGVFAVYKKLEKPSFEEGFDMLYTVEIALNNEFTVKEWRR